MLAAPPGGELGSSSAPGFCYNFSQQYGNRDKAIRLQKKQRCDGDPGLPCWQDCLGIREARVRRHIQSLCLKGALSLNCSVLKFPRARIGAGNASEAPEVEPGVFSHCRLPPAYVIGDRLAKLSPRTHSLFMCGLFCAHM